MPLWGTTLFVALVTASPRRRASSSRHATVMSKWKVVVVVVTLVTNYSAMVNVETIRPRLSVLRQYLPVLQLGVPSGRSWLHEVGEVANGRRVG